MRWSVGAALIGALFPVSIEASEVRSSSVAPALWVGHQVTRGRRELPVLGTIETRTDTWVLASAEIGPDTIRVVERACRVRVEGAAGATVIMPDPAVERLPPVVVRYERGADGVWSAVPWRAGWDRADHDRDGNPGFTVQIDAPLCGGRLYLASDVRSVARARWSGGALVGETKVRLAQTILGTEGACLGVLSSDETQRMTGRFAYAPVPPSATCASLAREGWLDRPLAEREP